uniref:Uncharacterized protein n=1 Tax=Megaselia scalaris TaxID=36166 RepID=T1H1G1_MEGSC
LDCLFDLRKLLIICHYCKTPRANNLPLHTIQEMMAEFIWFSIVEEDTKPKFRDYPIIFAQGPSKKEIQKYSIIIKDLEIELPQNTSFIESFDYLIKTYYVLNINFPSILKVCFDFIMLNIYKIKTKSKIDTKKPEIENRYSKPNNFLFNVESWIEQNSK